MSGPTPTDRRSTPAAEADDGTREVGGRGDAVLVVGDVLLDVVTAPCGPLRPGSDTAAATRVAGGGSAANTACWLAAAGVPVRLVAAVGDDEMGAVVTRELDRAGVRHLGPVLPGVPTGTCVVLVDQAGERTMLPDRGASAVLAPEHLDPAWADPPPAWVHLSGYTLLHPGSRAAGRALVEQARSRRVPVSIDAASAGPIGDVGAAAARGLVAGADLVFANEDEVAALGGESELLRGIAAIVTKRGAAGASWTDGTRRVEVAAPPAEVRDTTGAGDAFAAGFLAALLAPGDGADPSAALTAGVATAALAVSRPGGRPAGRGGAR